jgi:hypothetical protein
VQIGIQARSFSLTDALRSHAEWRLRFALTLFDNHIQGVLMQLSDIWSCAIRCNTRLPNRKPVSSLPEYISSYSSWSDSLDGDRSSTEKRFRWLMRQQHRCFSDCTGSQPAPVNSAYQ